VTADEPGVLVPNLPKPSRGIQQKEAVAEWTKSPAAIVSRIFADTIAGDSAGRIARRLNDDGVPSPQGARWSANTVAVIVENPVYVGERYGVKRAHPATVSRRVFNAANVALGQRRAEWAAKRKSSE
jgi:hypothetical protein